MSNYTNHPTDRLAGRTVEKLAGLVARMSLRQITGRQITEIALVVVLSVAAVWVGLDRDDETPTPGGGAARGQGAVAAGGRTERVAPVDAASAPAAGVVLPTGSATSVDDLPVGFPRTDLGAVAMPRQVAWLQFGFDYDQAAAVARTYAAAGEEDALVARSRDVIAARRAQAGLPADGEVPAPASYYVTTLAYTLEELDTDLYAVNLLSYITLTTAAGESRDSLYAGTQLVTWQPDDPGTARQSSDENLDQGSGAAEGDWKIVTGSPELLQSLVEQGQPAPAAPDTAEFAEAGWIKLSNRPGDGAGNGAGKGASNGASKTDEPTP